MYEKRIEHSNGCLNHTFASHVPKAPDVRTFVFPSLEGGTDGVPVQLLGRLNLTYIAICVSLQNALVVDF